MKKIQLTKGKFAIVDDEDFVYLSRFSWHFNVDEACMTLHDTLGRDRHFEMHKFLVKHPPGVRVLYFNGDSLDNRKENLRFVSVNYSVHRNKKATSWGGKATTSKYKGVSWHKNGNRWMAYVGEQKKREYLGLFHSEKLAAEAYNKKAKELYGKFAYQNKL